MSDDSAGLSANSSLLLQNTASLLFLQQSTFGQNAIDDYLKQASASASEERRSQESSSPGSRQSPYSIETILRSNSDASSVKLSGNVKKQESADNNGASSSDNANAVDGNGGEVLCAVCNDVASGQHYGASTCFGCKGFFRRVLRQNKVFVCRYEGQCQIDKIGRNACRSCRFKKCLDVGMDVTAIRPDRDKTGRQKNPRRSTSHSMRSDDMPTMHTDDEGLDVARSNRSHEDDTSSNDGDKDLRSHCENPAMVAERDLVLQTLCEIERICYQLRDATQPEAQADAVSLADVIANASLLTPRTQLDYSGTNAAGGSHEYAGALKRLLVLAVDYANTLKPIADLSQEEKAALLRSFTPAFAILTTAYQSIVQARIDQVFLPNGSLLDDGATLVQELSGKWSDEKLSYFVEKFRSLSNSMKFGLQMNMAKLDLTEIEYVTLKAIVALDTNTPDVSRETAEILSVARESVQNALHLHLLEKYPSTQAISRFGRILMLSASITKLGAQLGQLVHLSSEVFPEVGGVVAQLVS